MLENSGSVLIAAGTAPLDPGYALLPAGLFRLAPTTGKLSLFAPVSGVALKPGPGGAFGTDIFVARPRFFNVRGHVLVQPGDGEIFRVTPPAILKNLTVNVFTRSLDFAPTGIAFGPVGSLFPGDLLVTDFFGAGARRIKSTGATFPFTKYPGLQGLTFGPGGTSAFGADVYAAQPSAGRILRIAANGVAVPFATGLTSPVDVAFGPGGAFGKNLYVADAGGQIYQIDSAGKRTLFAAGLGAPFALAFSPTGSTLFVTDYWNGNVIQFIPPS
jgi:hypothetical protein